jgi:hypothetical protein
MDLRALAQEYLAAGWHPLPLPPFEKYPPPGGSTGYGGVDLTDIEVENAAWMGNIGLRMPADVIGLDVDAYHGGAETLRDLELKLCPLPMTYVSHSNRRDGSGIMFFRVPVGMGWIPGLPGIEVIQRGHRYAVVFPSLHPEGRAYAWSDQAEPDVLQGVPQVEDLAELPWPWIEELSRATGGADEATQAVTGATRHDFLVEHTAADAPGYVTDKIVGHFNERRAAGFSRHDTMQHCLTWAMECVRAGISSGEATVAELGSAWQHAMASEPRRAALTGVQATEFEAMLRHAIGKVKDRPDAEFHKLHDDIAGVAMQATGPPTLATGTSSATVTIGDYQSPTSLLPAPIRWDEFVERDTAPQTWLVEGFWPWGRAMALWAAAKMGKSELALWCACKLALGEHPWLAGVAIDPVDVAYFDYEMTADDLDDRLTDFGINPRRLGRLHYWQLPALHALDGEAGGREMEQLVTGVGAQAVVIDTFGRAVDGDENEADTVRGFARHTGLRLKALGVGYIRTDHAGKDMSKGQRGSSAKRDDVDVVWSQKRTDQGVMLDCKGSSRLSWVEAQLELDRTEVNGQIAYSQPIRMAWTPAAMAKAKELDAIGVPVGATASQTIDALKGANKTPGRKTVLLEAIKYRQAVKPAGTTSGTTPQTGTGTDDGNQ